MFATEIEVEWADCDPAGIVFYPHFFRFMDTTMQRLMRARGMSLERLKADFGSIGAPLVEANASFRSPARPGDRLTVEIASRDWKAKTFRLGYRGRIGDRVVFEGHEVRIFGAIGADGRLRALEVPAAFRTALS